MGRSKIAISSDKQVLNRLDRLVKEALFPNGSQAIQVAAEQKPERLKRSRLARERAKLDPEFEKGLAEEGFSEELAERPES